MQPRVRQAPLLEVYKLLKGAHCLHAHLVAVFRSDFRRGLQALEVPILIAHRREDIALYRQQTGHGLEIIDRQTTPMSTIPLHSSERQSYWRSISHFKMMIPTSRKSSIGLKVCSSVRKQQQPCDGHRTQPGIKLRAV